MPGCATCGAPACVDCQDPYGGYSLVGQTWLNNVEGIETPCPEGFICGPGGPPWDPPPPPPPDPTCPSGDCPGGGGEGTTIQLEGCESTIVRQIPAGISDAAYQVILNEMLTERAAQAARCEQFPQDPPGPTTRVYYSNEYCLECPNGNPMTQPSGILPPGLFLNESGLLCCPAASFSGVISQEDVDLSAAVFVNESFATLEEDGVLSCDAVWGFTFGAGTPGFDCTGNTIDIEMQGVPPSRFTASGGPCGGLTGDIWSAEQYRTWGPFEVDKDVLISGTADYVRGTILCAGGGAGQMQVAATGLTSYSGNYNNSFFSSTASIHQVFSITGTLLAGNTLTVYAKGILNILLTNGSSMDIGGTVSVVDA